MRKLRLQYVDVDRLVPSTENARLHSAKQIDRLKDSLRLFGFVSPMLIDKSMVVIAGHGRLAAAKQLGMRSVPTLRIDHLNDAQVRALRLADNRLAELSTWDRDALRKEFQLLSELDLDFDLPVTGFEAPEIDILLSLDEGQDAAAEPAPPEPPACPVTVPGDCWQVGEHRLICGDVRIRSVTHLLMSGRKAAQICCDPPYNIRVTGFAGGKGRIKHREFACASGEIDQAGFRKFLDESLGAMAHHCEGSALAYVFMDWRHVADLISVGEQALGPLVNMAVWHKTNAGMGSLYRSAHELVPIFRVGDGKAVNNVQLGRFGRNRTNVWTYPSVNSFGAAHRRREHKDHPTPKPVALVADAIRDASKRGDIILDGFAGGGATLVAAHRTGRIGYGIEIDPRYCDVIIRRLTSETGQQAVLQDDGRDFQAVAQSRLSNVGGA